MTDLRKAAEDMLETLDKPFTASKTIFQAKEALRQALAQPEQEPSKQFHEWACAEHQKILAESANSTTGVVESKALAQPEQCDQTALELCKKCGWKAVIPDEGCLVCARKNQKPVAWMPIDSAPKGRIVLVHYKNSLGSGRTMRARYYLPEALDSDTTESGWADEGWYEESEAYEYLMPLEYEPTHWMPLPDGPDTLKEKNT